MIWLLFTNKIRKAFKIPKLFTVFEDDDNGKMFKFIICAIVLLFIMLFSLGCVTISAGIIPGVLMTPPKAAPPAPAQ